MPNWCDNVIYVGGTDEAKAKVREIFEGDDAFATIMPEPDYDKVVVPFSFPDINEMFGKEKEVPKVGRPDAWWDWRNQNWGTKWEPRGTEITRENTMFSSEEELLVIYHRTAWAPATGIYNKISEMDGVTAVVSTYSEPGVDFVGADIFVKSHPDEAVSLTMEHGEFEKLYEKVKDNDDYLSKLVTTIYDTFEGAFELFAEMREEAKEEVITELKEGLNKSVHNKEVA